MCNVKSVIKRNVTHLTVFNYNTTLFAFKIY